MRSFCGWTPAGESNVARRRGVMGAGLLLGMSLAACFDAKHIIFTKRLANGAADAGASSTSAQGASTLSADAGRSPEDIAASGDLPLGGTPGQLGGSPAVDAGTETAPAGALCSLPAAAPAGATLFSGTLVGGTCQTALDAPHATTWFAYQDSGDALAVAAEAPGCVANTCALHVEGPPAGLPGYANYGAGVALPLLAPEAPFDASSFSGVQFWARGTINGTRGPAQSNAPQTLFFKLVTATNRAGDDFGAFCTLDATEWTLCTSTFAALTREGFAAPDPATDLLDIQSLLRVELEFRLYRDTLGAVPVPVSVAIDVADVSFF